MKKIFVFLLALIMVLGIAACGEKEENGITSKESNVSDTMKKEEEVSVESEEIQQEEQAVEEQAEGFAMPTLNSYDAFPPAEYWTALGLPEDFTIEITEMEYSSKNSIYPLNAKDGNMFDCVVSDNKAAYTALADSLWNGGIKGVSPDGTEAAERGEVDIYDIDVNIYKAYWNIDGELMSIEVRARDGSNRVSVTVKYAPED